MQSSVLWIHAYTIDCKLYCEFRTLQSHHIIYNSIPASTLARCPILIDPANGEVSVTGNSPGDTATYTCDSDYDLVGPQILTCGDDGMWSDGPPTCLGVGMKTAVCSMHASLSNNNVCATLVK